MADVCPCPNPGSTVTGRDQFRELMFRDEFPDATHGSHGSEAQEARANGACAFAAMPVVAAASRLRKPCDGSGVVNQRN